MPGTAVSCLEPVSEPGSVLHRAGEILVVCAHVHESVAREVEQYHLALSAFAASEGLVHRSGYRVA